MPVIVDSYSETNSDGGVALYGADNPKYSQSFTATVGTLNSCKFYLEKSSGSPTGNVYEKLYAHSGTYGESSLPTGSPLAISDPIDAAGLGSLALVTFTFSGANKYSLLATNYVLTIEFDGGDYENYLGVYYDYTSPTHSGNFGQYVNWGEGFAWEADAGVDLCFYVYKDDVGGSSIKTVNGLAIASVKTVNGLAIASVKTINGLA